MKNTPEFGSVTTTLPPGKNPGDQIDTYVSRYAHPAVFIGQVGKKFVVNSMIQLDADALNSPTLAAEGEELDLQILDSKWWGHNKKFTVHGKTIVLTGKDQAADDSYLEMLAGTNLLRQGLIINGIRYGGRPLALSDSGFGFYTQGDLEATKPGTSVMLAQLGSMNMSGNFASLLLFGSHDHSRTATTTGWGEEGSLHLGVQEKQDAGVLNGTTVGCINWTGGGQIVWNPVGHHCGIGIGTGNGPDVQYGFFIDNGKVTAPHGLIATDDIRTHADICASGDINAGKTVTATRFLETLATPTSSGTSCKPSEFTDDHDYHYVCVSENHWRRAALYDF